MPLLFSNSEKIVGAMQYIAVCEVRLLAATERLLGCVRLIIKLSFIA